MNENEKQHARALIDRLIAEAQNDVEQKAYARALTAIRKAKVLDITNVYMFAFERQVEQLNELTASGSLTDEQRTDILDSLPGIIEAAKSIQTPLATPETADAERRSTPEQLEQMRAARQWLRNQYFQRAHEYVKKQEYDRALAELRRVYVIDKDDVFAHEFELKILQMVELQKQKPPEPAEAPAAGPGMRPADTDQAEDGPGKAASTPAPSAGTSEASAEGAELSAETSGSSPGISGLPADAPDLAMLETEAPSGLAGEDSTPSGTVSGKNNRLLFIAMGIAIAVIAFALYYSWKREQPAEPVVPPPSDETQQEVSDGEPTYAIPPVLPMDTTKTDSTQTDTTDTSHTPAGADTPASMNTPDTTRTDAAPSP